MRQPLINQIHKLLIKRQKTLAVAESCTGGLVSNLLTRISGSSRYFILGIVVYSNQSKERILGVPRKIIARKGAVSKEAAAYMAERIRVIAKTNFGLGITGIAGPTGATLKKPVGTVFIAIDAKNKKICKNFHFTGSRNVVRKKAALKSLALLKKML